MKRIITVAMFALGLAISAHASPFTFYDDFSAGVSGLWTISTSYNNNDPGILGELADGSATLSLVSPGPSAPNGATLSFDLLGFRTVDGAYNCCTDTFNLTINGTWVFSGSFDMGGGGSNVIWYDPNGASVSYPSGHMTQITIPFTLLAGSNTLKFDYGNMQGFGDEAWGLDNVDIAADVTTTTPEPASLLLLGAGLFGLVGFKKWFR